MGTWKPSSFFSPPCVESHLAHARTYVRTCVLFSFPFFHFYKDWVRWSPCIEHRGSPSSFRYPLFCVRRLVSYIPRIYQHTYTIYSRNQATTTTTIQVSSKSGWSEYQRREPETVAVTSDVTVSPSSVTPSVHHRLLNAAVSVSACFFPPRSSLVSTTSTMLISFWFSVSCLHPLHSLENSHVN